VVAVGTRRSGAQFARDLAAAALWIVVVVPSSFGFWLVAGDLAGVPASEQRTLVLASLLGLGIATLLQVLLGYRLPVFEGPASTYLAAVAVLNVSAAGARPEAVTGGLLTAGVLVFALGLLGADRPLKRIFTPPVLVAFLVIVVITVVPATVTRAIGRSGDHPWGIAAAWLSTAVVVTVAVGGRAVRWFRSYSLLGALVLGTLTYFLLEGFPGSAGTTGWEAPAVFPWGAPVFSFSVAAPFLIAALLASFNTVASINMMAASHGLSQDPRAERRGLMSHGAAQALTASFGNLLGNVPRLDSVGIVRMIGNARPQALALAAAGILALSFIGPAVELLAKLPIAVSAALLAVVLGMMVYEAIQQAVAFDRRRRWLVLVPAIAPAFIWLPIADQLSERAQLLTNPLLVGVVLAVVLDRLVPPSRSQDATPVMG
jgi:xanthine/uracil permease